MSNTSSNKPNITLPESGEFNFWTNFKNANPVENYKITYERLANSNPQAPQYQLKISAGVGAGAEFFARISTSASYEIGMHRLFEAISTIAKGLGGKDFASKLEIVVRDKADPIFYQYINQNGEEANNIFADLTSGALANLFDTTRNENNPGQSGFSSIITIEGNKDGVSTSIVATKSTDNIAKKDSIQISSDNYSQDQLLKSSKLLIKSQKSGTKIDLEASDGKLNGVLIDKALMKEVNKYLNTELNFNESLLNFDDDNSSVEADISLVKNTQIKLQDGTTSTIDSVINAVNSAKAITEEFVNGYINQVQDLFTKEDAIAGLISDVNAAIQRGDSPEKIAKFIATKIAVKQLLDQGSKEIKQEIQKALVGNSADQIAIENGDLLNVSENGLEKLQELESITQSPAFDFGYRVTIAYATTLLLNMNEGWDSEEYSRAAVDVSAQIVGQYVVAQYMGTGASASGVGAAASYMISAGLNDLRADDHMNAHQWQTAMVSAAVLGVAAYIGFALGGPIGAVIASVIVSQFMGGKEYSEGQYPEPYSFFHITAKEDGSGNIIQGIEQSGIVAFASENGNDDIYGTAGQDIMVGKSGKNTIYGYEGNDHIEGRGNDDVLIGGKGDDNIFAGNGDDYLYGEDGNDQLEGGNGADAIVAGSGNDTISGGAGDDQIQGDDGDDYIEGNDGDDIILGGAGIDIIDGGAGDDIILGEDGDDIILAGSGNDSIEGGAGVDIIYASAGNDNIKGGENDDEIYGEAGIDIIYGDGGSDIINAGAENDLVFGGLGNDIIFGGAGDDSLYGEFGNDYLIGGVGSDVIEGYDGDDVIVGGEGNDAIKGGAGNDTYIYSKGDGQDIIDDEDELGSDVIKFTNINSKLSDNASNSVALSKTGDDLTIIFKSDKGEIIADDNITIKNYFVDNDENSTTKKIDRIEFADGKKIELKDISIDADSTINYSLVAYNNIDTAIQAELALGYQDILSMQNQELRNPDSSFYSDNYETASDEKIDNEKYNEVQWHSVKKSRSAFGGHYHVWEKYYEENLSGTNGNDRIVGNWWSESIKGGDGDDQLYGNDGNDVVKGGNGNDLIYGGSGNDELYGEVGNDKIFGGSGVDLILGGAGNDDLSGGEGDDELQGNDGDDKIRGDAGIDSIDAGAGNDIVDGGTSADSILGGEGNDLLQGSAESDSIKGGAGNDAIYGQDASDNLEGGEGDDYISGGSGDDIIAGDAGNDTIFGDLGNDQINAGDGNDYVFGGAGVDLIMLGAGNDTAQLGDGDDYAQGEDGDDAIKGGAGSDEIIGGAGDDALYGESGGDILNGNDGNDILNGGMGNDIITDGKGSDVIDGGFNNDIIIITKEDNASDSIDVIKGFNKDEDKIIIKVNYKNPLSFSQLQSIMVQDGANVRVDFNNGQKLIIENILKTDLSENNLAIGLATSDEGEILFGDDGDEILFGGTGDDVIYGGGGNDEIWGGKGKDALYGQAGNDVLRYEADGKYGWKGFVYGGYIDVVLSGYLGSNYVWGPTYIDTFDHSIKYNNINNQNNNDVFIEKNFLNRSEFSVQVHNAFDEPLSGLIDYYYNNVYEVGFAIKERIVAIVTRTEYQDLIQHNFYTKNFYNNKTTDINGYNRTYDIFDGGEGIDVLLMTEGNDVLALDDPTSPKQIEGARVKDIAMIYAGDGDDVVNFSTPKFTYQNLTVYGGSGNDKIWSNQGNDAIFGQNGNDEIFAGIGNDLIDGGAGNDIVYGGAGSDIIEGGDGDDKIYGEGDNDLIYASQGSDIIDGGSGVDTISFINSNQAIKLVSPSPSTGGFAQGDIIVNIENIIATNFDDVISGNFSEITAGKGNDYIKKSFGKIIYHYATGDGQDIINSHGTDDTIKFGENISQNNINFLREDNDLIINFTENLEDKITIKNHFRNGKAVEKVEFFDGSFLELENLIIASEGEADFTTTIPQFQLILTKTSSGQITVNASLEGLGKISLLPSAQKSSDNYSKITTKITSSFGLVSLAESSEYNSKTQSLALENINAISNSGILNLSNRSKKIKYNLPENFNGIDILKYEFYDKNNELIGSKLQTIFIESKNDAPTSSLTNQTIKIEESFAIKLSDYFSDIDGDNLTYNIKLNGQALPDWINFNQQTQTISGVAGKIEALNFEITASDNKGGEVKTNFQINITKNEVTGISQLNFSDVIKAKINFANYQNANFNIKDGSNFAEKINAVEGNNIINSQGGNDEIIGGAQNDIIYSGEGDDKIYSGAAQDIITSGDGSDLIKAGEGDDIITSEAGSDEIYGEAGNDFILSEVGDDKIYGGLGNDEIIAGTGDDYISGGEGADILTGGAGKDNILGDAGDDKIVGNDGDDKLSGGDGQDKIYGGSGNDEIFAGLGNDQIWANEGNDTINSGAGDDYISAGDGNDKIASEAGNDQILAGLGNDEVWAGSGNDNILGEDGDDYINGGDGNDVIKGNYGNDILSGGNNNDKLYGNEGQDKLYGGMGNDTIIGGLASDVLFGNEGQDIFTFTTLQDSNKANIDLISDFKKGEDKIDLSIFDYNNIIFASSQNLTQGQNAQNLYYHYEKEGNKTITIIEDLNSDFAIKMNGKIELENADFMF